MGGGTAGSSQGPSGKINLRTSIYFEDLHNQSWKRMKNSEGRVILRLIDFHTEQIGQQAILL